MPITDRSDMRSQQNRGAFESGSSRGLRAAALTAVLLGAIGSVALMLRLGGHNKSQVLIALMATWVLSPFIPLACAHAASKRWSPYIRVALYRVTLFITLASLAIYGIDAVRPLAPKAAFIYVVVPPASWLLIAVVVSITASISRSRSRRSDGAGKSFL